MLDAAKHAYEEKEKTYKQLVERVVAPKITTVITFKPNN